MEKKSVTVYDIERKHYIEYTKKLQDWHKNIVTLSTGGLTILVSFQKNYVPQNPDAIILIQICWVALAICICCGLLVSFGQAQSRLDAANDLRKQLRIFGEQAVVERIAATNGLGFMERIIFRIARVMLPLAFLVSLVCLVWFAVINVGK